MTRLQREYGGTVVLLGSRAERAAVALATPRGGRHLDLSGRTRLATLAAVVARLDLLLANDSGPAHLAYALTTPSVTVFLATDPLRWGPPVPGPHQVVAPCLGATRATIVRGVVDAAARLLG